VTRPGHRHAALVAALLVAGLLAGTGCARGTDSSTDIVLLGPSESTAMLEDAAAAYEEGHPGVDVHTVTAPTSQLAAEVRSQTGTIDVVVSDDRAVLDGLGPRIGGKRTLARDASGARLVAGTLSDSQHTDLAGDLLRWLTTSPAHAVLAAHGWH
jgi:extracellular solute-binding protein